MTLNATRIKVPHIPGMLNYSTRVPNFNLWSLVFNITEVFDFSMGYSGEFEIFEKLKLEISKILNVLVWGPFTFIDSFIIFYYLFMPPFFHSFILSFIHNVKFNII